jgi:hypothetical protein
VSQQPRRALSAPVSALALKTVDVISELTVALSSSERSPPDIREFADFEHRISALRRTPRADLGTAKTRPSSRRCAGFSACSASVSPRSSRRQRLFGRWPCSREVDRFGIRRRGCCVPTTGRHRDGRTLLPALLADTPHVTVQGERPALLSCQDAHLSKNSQEGGRFGRKSYETSFLSSRLPVNSGSFSGVSP